MSNPLDYRAPDSGRMADYYNVATTAAFLAPRNPKPSVWLAAARHATALHAISGKLHRIAEKACNYGLTARDEKRQDRLAADAAAIAAHYGCRSHYQGDPRGCSLYLIPDEIVPASWAAIPGDPLEAYVYGSEAKSPPSLAALQARWIDSNYNRGYAVARIGR